MNPKIQKTVLALAVANLLGLSACSDNSKTINSIPVNKTTSGVITGFGSVFINGIEYETDGARFVVDGVVGDETLLKLGMVVSLKGSALTDGIGDAVSIEFDDDVEGVVISKNIDADGVGSMNIMGITVNVDGDTVFESKDAGIVTIADVDVGNIIEVSGHSSGDGNVWATRLEVKSAVKEAGKEMEMKGIISALDDVAKTFVVGSITINYMDAELNLEDGINALANELFVEVKSEEGIDGDGVLIASKVELEDGGEKSLDYEADDDEVELEGVITNVVSLTEIEVNGHTVLLSDVTKYVHGSADVAAEGMKIKIRGGVNVDGQLVAEKVIFKPSGDLKLAGRISATDITANTVTVFGVALKLDNSTLVKDDREDDDLDVGEENVKYKFGVDDLIIGDWVKVKAYTNKVGGLTATKMERKSADKNKKEKLVGKLVLDADTSAYTIAGIKLDLNNAEITPVAGTKVELKGTYRNGVFVAAEGEAKEQDKNYIGGDDGDESDLNKTDEHDGKEDDDTENHGTDAEDEKDDGASEDDGH